MKNLSNHIKTINCINNLWKRNDDGLVNVNLFSTVSWSDIIQTKIHIYDISLMLSIRYKSMIKKIKWKLK